MDKTWTLTNGEPEVVEVVRGAGHQPASVDSLAELEGAERASVADIVKRCVTSQSIVATGTRTRQRLSSR
jgi:cation transport ATPase